MKDPSVVLIDRHGYINRTDKMLYVSSKFEEINIKPETEIKFMLQEEDRLTAFLKWVKISKSDALHKALFLEALSQALNIMYSLSKINKSFLYITPNYNLYICLTMEQQIIDLTFVLWLKYFTVNK